MILVVGATGELGSRIATRLRARGRSVRALVRPRTDAAALEAQGVELVRGDLQEPASLSAAVDGAATVITTATAISRALGGERSATIRAVDLEGNANLVDAAERAAVRRFVFVSFAQSAATLRSPLGSAKQRTEARLSQSTMETVVVRPELFSEIWISHAVGFDLSAGRVQIFGKGENANGYIAIDDVAEAVVRLALAESPPQDIAFGGPDPMTRKQIVERFERRSGHGVKARHIPRSALRAGARVLNRVKPVQASLMALALHMDVERTSPAERLLELGIEPQRVGDYVDELGRQRAQ